MFCVTLAYFYFRNVVIMESKSSLSLESSLRAVISARNESTFAIETLSSGDIINKRSLKKTVSQLNKIAGRLSLELFHYHGYTKDEIALIINSKEVSK